MLALVLVVVVAACDRIFPERVDLTLPDPSAVAAIYEKQGVDAEFRFSGNVLELVVQQDRDQLRRGGPLWARVGPYIYLFTSSTRDVLERYPGIAAVRVITKTGDVEVARAMLLRDALNEITWQRAIAVNATALTQGTTRPSTMDALARYGEEITTHEYNPDYVPPREE